LDRAQESQNTTPRRRRWLAWAIAAVAVVAVAGGAVYVLDQRELHARLIRAEPESIPDDAALRAFAIAYGTPVFKANCASCHGDNMKGDPDYGVPDFTRGEWLYGEGRVSEIERTILFGIRAGNGRTLNFADMPAFARPVPYRRYQIDPLEPQEIRDVVTYLMMAGGKPGNREAAARGAKIYGDKGQCFDCHAGDGKGDAAIGAPNLIDDKWLHGNGTFEDIYAVVARGSAGVCPAWYQRLSPVQIRALAVVVHEARRSSPAVRSASQEAPRMIP
jgi:cytochrome c oxidase cbb3-type subunit 3